MKTRILSLALALLLSFCLIPAGALTLDTPEEATEALDLAEEAVLSGLTEEDAVLYAPADAHGNLVGFISFDNQNVNRDPVSFAPGMASLAGAACSFGFEADPAGERDGYVLHVLNTSALHRLVFNLFASDDAACLETGLYTLAFDAYTSTSTPKDSYFRFDIGSKSVSFANDVYNNRGAWKTYSLTIEVVSTDGTDATIKVNGDDAGTIGLRPSFNVWLQKTANSHMYLDNIALYRFPTGHAAFIDQNGSRATADVSAMTAYPLPSAVIPGADDTTFDKWKDESGNYHEAGDTVTAGALAYTTLTGVGKTYVAFNYAGSRKAVTTLAAVPYPSELDSSWSDDGFYAWYDDYTDAELIPGSAIALEDYAEAELTAITVAEHNAATTGLAIDANGILLASADFEAGTRAYAYTDSRFFTAGDITAWANTVGVIDDPTSSGRGKVLNTAHSGAYRILFNHSATVYPGTVKYIYDTYLTSTNYVYRLTDFNQVTTPYPTSIKGTWYTYTGTHEVTEKMTLGTFHLITAGADTIYVDNFSMYWRPLHTVIFENGGEKALYYTGADTTFTVPTPSEVNANWSDTGFTAWIGSDGTSYTPGTSVSDKEAVTFANKIVTVTFSMNGATATTGSFTAMPYPSEVDGSWSDDGIYGWTADGVTYRAGEAVTTDDVDGKTFTPVTIAAYNAASAETVTENGILLLAADFEAGTESYSYVDGSVSNPGITAWSNSHSAVDDPTSSGRGKVYAVTHSGGFQTRFTFNATVGKGTVTYKVDTYLTNQTYIWKNTNFGQVSTPYPTDIQGKWDTYTGVHEVTDSAMELTQFVLIDEKADTIYVDNFSAAYLPAGAVIFEFDGEKALYYAGADGSFTVPTPAEVNANWSNDGFSGWQTAAGVALAAGETTTAAACAGVVTLFDETDERYAPETYETVAMRTTGTAGLRFSAFVTSEKRAASDEYGFLVARTDVLDGTDLVFPSGFVCATEADETKTGTTPDGKKFVCGASYIKDGGVDKFYVEEKDGESGFRFTTCLVGLTGKSQFMNPLTVRPYTLVNGTYFYGAAVSKDAYTLAKALYAAGDTSDYVTSIIAACEE